MTHEEIVKKADELFPDELFKGNTTSIFKGRAAEREAYIKGYEDALASLPKVKAWVARSRVDSPAHLFAFPPERDMLVGYYGMPFSLTNEIEVSPESPIEVELLIVKK